jgi:hypothetical protein
MNPENKLHTIETARSLIAKHQSLLDLTFFDRADLLSTALYDEELGWIYICCPEGQPLRIQGLTPEKLRLAYERSLPAAVTYHQRVCGQMSHATRGSKRLGCPGACQITLETYGMDGKGTLSTDEAELLWSAYTHDLKTVKDFCVFYGALYTPEVLLRLANSFGYDKVE